MAALLGRILRQHLGREADRRSEAVDEAVLGVVLGVGGGPLHPSRWPRRLALVDELTGLHNRRALVGLADQLLKDGASGLSRE